MELSKPWLFTQKLCKIKYLTVQAQEPSARHRSGTVLIIRMRTKTMPVKCNMYDVLQGRWWTVFEGYIVMRYPPAAVRPKPNEIFDVFHGRAVNLERADSNNTPRGTSETTYTVHHQFPAAAGISFTENKKYAPRGRERVVGGTRMGGRPRGPTISWWRLLNEESRYLPSQTALAFKSSCQIEMVAFRVRTII